jgi:hypothetical protein
VGRTSERRVAAGLVAEGFGIFVTVDRNLIHQQDVTISGVAIIVLHARGNRLQDLVPLVPALREAVAAARRGVITHVGK